MAIVELDHRVADIAQALARILFETALAAILELRAGTDDGSTDQGGSRSSVAAMVSDAVGPANGDWPLSISNSTHPNAQMSVRLSTASPRACSGLM